jgi:hypothetical protein
MTLRSLASIIWGLLVIVVVASAQTGAGDPNLDDLREQLRQIDAELSRVRLESLDLAAQSRAVADDIAELDREESLLGPVKRARYDRLRQRGAALTDQQTLLDTARDQLLGSYGDVAQVLVDALTAEIDRARAGYQLLSRSSSEAATEWRRFVELRRERQAIQDRVTPTGRYIELDVFIEPDDSAETLERKADLLADSRDITVGVLSQLTRWGRQLEEDQIMYEENLKLLEENELFRSGDPLDLPPGGVGFDAAPAISLPPTLFPFSERLPIPEGGVSNAAGYNQLLADIARLASELEDDVLEMSENEKRMRDEARVREGVE